MDPILKHSTSHRCAFSLGLQSAFSASTSLPVAFYLVSHTLASRSAPTLPPPRQAADVSAVESRVSSLQPKCSECCLLIRVKMDDNLCGPALHIAGRSEIVAPSLEGAVRYNGSAVLCEPAQ